MTDSDNHKRELRKFKLNAEPRNGWADQEHLEHCYGVRMAGMTAAVRRHAGRNYETSGWDFVIEAWDDTDIRRIIEEAGARTHDEAIAACLECCKLRDEMRREVCAEIF